MFPLYSSLFMKDLETFDFMAKWPTMFDTSTTILFVNHSNNVQQFTYKQ